MAQRQFSEDEIQFFIDVLPRFKTYVKDGIAHTAQEEIPTKIIKITREYMEHRITHEERRQLGIQRLLKLTQYRSNNYFKINEVGNETEKFYSVDNLADYTARVWEDHRALTREDFSRREGETQQSVEDRLCEIYGDTYDRLYMSGTWCSWLESKESIVFGNLCSLESYCQDVLEGRVMEFIDDLIPHKVVSDHSSTFDEEAFGFVDMELRAGGREDEYKSLMSKIPAFEREFMNRFFPALQNRVEGMVFKRDDDLENVLIVVPSLETARKIKTRSFLKSVFELEQPFSLLEREMESVLIETGFREKFMEVYEENKKG